VAKGTVCITFDFDAFSSKIMPGMPPSPGMMSRGEFAATAVPRVLRLLEREGIATTWYVPGHTADTYPDLCRRIADAGHELALHGYLHEQVSMLTPEQERDVLARSREALYRVTGDYPVGNRAPGWDVSASTIDLLVAAGVEYDSSLMARDYQPYFARTGDVINLDGPVEFGSETSLVELGVEWSLCDFPHFEFLFAAGVLLQGLRRVDDVVQNWIDEVRYMTTHVNDGVCTLTLHPEVMGRGHRMLGLERFIAETRDLGVEFARHRDVAEQVRAGRRFGVENELVS
jgi:peptidoglycan/xylan/chitin deacetylase (PgdA/CDA1 family)